MTLQINGEERRFEHELTLAALMAELRLQPERVAIELNQNLVQRAQFGNVALRDGDRVEIVTFVGGG